MNHYYIYCYLDPRKPGKFQYSNFSFLFEPFYIGKGKDQRWKRHFCPSVRFSTRENKHKKNKIDKIIRETGKFPFVVKLFENISENEAFDLEIKLIKEIGRVDLKTGFLLNLTDGGEGMSGNKMTIETKMKLSEQHRGMKATEETKKKMSLSRLGNKRSPDVLIRLRSKFRDPNKKPKFYIRDVQTNEEFYVPNLSSFCEERNLCRSSITSSIFRNICYMNRYICKKINR